MRLRGIKILCFACEKYDLKEKKQETEWVKNHVDGVKL